MLNDLHRAVERGVKMLLTSAEPGGLWKDYELPVGTSSAWVTAYVANALLDARSLLSDTGELDDACGRARNEIRARFRPGEGWGYHERVEPDADSTALAVLFLQRVGIDDSAARAALLHFRRSDGGYGTFVRTDERNAWGHTHADVLPTVLRAFEERDGDLVLPHRHPAGFWRSYWWHSDVYATEACLRLLSECGRRNECERSRSWLLECATPSGAFEEALSAAALATLQPDEPVQETQTSLLLSLLESQRNDGSWPAGARLRITLPACARPWDAPSARLYLDGGTFTSATVVGALARILISSRGRVRVRR